MKYYARMSYYVVTPGTDKCAQWHNQIFIFQSCADCLSWMRTARSEYNQPFARLDMGYYGGDAPGWTYESMMNESDLPF